MSLPPGPPRPYLAQTVGWLTRPGPYSRKVRDRYGDVFTLNVEKRAPWVVLKPDKPFPRTSETMHSTTLGWRMVNPQMPDEWTVSLGEATGDHDLRAGLADQIAGRKPALRLGQEARRGAAVVQHVDVAPDRRHRPRPVTEPADQGDQHGRSAEADVQQQAVLLGLGPARGIGGDDRQRGERERSAVGIHDPAVSLFEIGRD